MALSETRECVAGFAEVIEREETLAAAEGVTAGRPLRYPLAGELRRNEDAKPGPLP
jgi:hypothetical protein